MRLLLILLALIGLGIGVAAPPILSPVTPRELVFPEDFGAHENFRIEWWYATGWLETADQKTVGFQVTFFRPTTEYDIKITQSICTETVDHWSCCDIRSSGG